MPRLYLIHALCRKGIYLATNQKKIDESLSFFDCAFNLAASFRKDRLLVVKFSYKWRNYILFEVHDLLKSSGVFLTINDLDKIQTQLDQWSHQRYWNIKDLRKALRLDEAYHKGVLTFSSFKSGLECKKRKALYFFLSHFSTRSYIEKKLEDKLANLFEKKSMLELLNYPEVNERKIQCGFFTYPPSAEASNIFNVILKFCDLKESVKDILDCQARLHLLRAYVAARRFAKTDKALSEGLG